MVLVNIVNTVRNTNYYTYLLASYSISNRSYSYAGFLQDSATSNPIMRDVLTGAPNPSKNIPKDILSKLTPFYNTLFVSQQFIYRVNRLTEDSFSASLSGFNEAFNSLNKSVLNVNYNNIVASSFPLNDPSLLLGRDFAGKMVPVKSIDANAFSGVTNLTAVNIPIMITSLGANCFKDCTALTSVKLSANLETIGPEAFAGSSLTSIEITDKVTSIGDLAFRVLGNSDLNVKFLQDKTLPTMTTGDVKSSFLNAVVTYNEKVKLKDNASASPAEVQQYLTRCGFKSFTAVTPQLLQATVTSAIDGASQAVSTLLTTQNKMNGGNITAEPGTAEYAAQQTLISALNTIEIIVSQKGANLPAIYVYDNTIPDFEYDEFNELPVVISNFVTTIAEAEFQVDNLTFIFNASSQIDTSCLYNAFKESSDITITYPQSWKRKNEDDVNQNNSNGQTYGQMVKDFEALASEFITVIEDVGQ
jgi:hypothetical protein